VAAGAVCVVKFAVQVPQNVIEIFFMLYFPKTASNILKVPYSLVNSLSEKATKYRA